MPDLEDVGAKVLGDAGWTPERAVSIEAYIEAVASAGYDLPERVGQFLTACGGLAVGAPTSGFAEVLAIDPVMAVVTTFKGTAETYEQVVGVSLIPVGAAYGGHLILMMAEDGRFFGGYDNYFAYAGRTAAELFGRISAERLEEIPIEQG